MHFHKSNSKTLKSSFKMCIVFLGYSYSTSICGDQAKGLSGEEEGCWLQCHLGRQSSMWLWGLEEAAKMPLRILGVL